MRYDASSRRASSSIVVMTYLSARLRMRENVIGLCVGGWVDVGGCGCSL